MRVGLTGSIGSGKSTVGKLLADLGCFVIQADELGHEILSHNETAKTTIIDYFLPRVPDLLDTENKIQRKVLGRYVFSNADELKVLDEIVHPLVQKKFEELASEFEESTSNPIVVYETALLMEYNLHKGFDHLIFTVCDKALHVYRAAHRDGIVEADIIQRTEHQLTSAQKVQKGFESKIPLTVIDTNKEMDEVERQVKACYSQLSKPKKIDGGTDCEA